MVAAAEVVAAPGWATPVPWRVAAARRETHDVVTLELEPPEGVPFAFRPGQFDMLAPFGMGEVPISISGDPAEPGRVAHTIRAVGAVTRALCALGPGDRVGLRGPFGTHWPVQEAEGRDVVIVAGGIGLPPLRPAVLHVLANRERYGRIAVLYGARTPDDLLFTDELAGWRSRFDVEVGVTVDSAVGGWQGTVGVVPDLIGRVGFDLGGAVAFVVGPEIMIRFAVQGLLAAGMSDADVFTSMERNMQCAVGMCGHCQLGPFLVCRDGPVFSHQAVALWLRLREV